MSIVVPENTIVALGDDPNFMGCHRHILEVPGIKRDWFNDHAYRCLPLAIGNRYGIAVKSLYEFTAVWDGEDFAQSVRIDILDGDGTTPEHPYPCQTVSSHFGMGTITVQNRFVLRTPPGVNLMTISPPNYFIDGLHYMTGVVETDNLRRDFTFNLRLTRPNHTVHIRVGDYVGCVLPVPRYFQDSFEVRDAAILFDSETIAEEHEVAVEFAKEREGPDKLKKHGNGNRYLHGEDSRGNRFPDHQRTVFRAELQ
jgi:hypothetical protein